MDRLPLTSRACPHVGCPAPRPRLMLHTRSLTPFASTKPQHSGPVPSARPSSLEKLLGALIKTSQAEDVLTASHGAQGPLRTGHVTQMEACPRTGLGIWVQNLFLPCPEGQVLSHHTREGHTPQARKADASVSELTSSKSRLGQQFGVGLWRSQFSAFGTDREPKETRESTLYISFN